MLAVALALGVMLVWSMYSHKDEPPPRATGSGQTPSGPVKPNVGIAGAAGSAAPAAGSGSAAGSGPAAGSGSAAGSVASQPAVPPADDQPRAPEETLKLTFPNVVATFSSYCGGLKTWQLTDKRYERDGTKGAILPEKSLMTMVDPSGKHVAVPADKLTNLPDCGAFDVNFASSTFVVPRHAVWTGTQVSPTEVRYSYASPQLDITKTFTVTPDKYLVRMVVAVTVHVPEGTEAREQLAVSMYAYQDPEGLKEGSSRVAARVWGSSTLRDGTLVQTDVAGVLEWPRTEPAIQWAGFEHPFLLSGYAPRLAEGEHVEKHTSASDGTNGMPRGFMQTYLLYPPAVIHHGDRPLTKEIVGYLGPKNYDDLATADASAGFPTGFSTVIDLGWFAFVGRPLLWLLQQFHSFIGNWGVAIILLTVVVKLLTLYWTTKSMRSMKAMAALAPQMKALQAKYADDKQRQQAETMALYKQHGVNPVAGCLPMLLQMPIWLALYKMLGNAGELYQQPFIPGWITDLTVSDPYYVLPILLVVTMFVQARLQPASVDSTQQKFMQYGMPLMFGAFSFVIPAGLTIYMFTNTVLSAVHSIYMNKFDKKSLEIASQLQKNKDLVAAEAAAATSPKPGGLGTGSIKSGAGKSGVAKSGVAKNGVAKAKRVIDAKATEVAPAEASAARDDGDDGDDGDDDAADPAGTSGAGPARDRPRRKKRRK
ncbi:MAG TPA: membrane protein insertase YidC [Kofleriaceae bacterium]|jgi:YidC/Oxa1 family membrane protein insertase|nr:membrane protein insertase YidC [Kofleriaceae bacterium]